MVDELEALSEAVELQLMLEVKQAACFSERACTIEVGWSASGAWHGTAPVAPKVAATIIGEIVAAAVRTEVSVDGRSTTSYVARLRWTAALADGRATTGARAFASNQPHPRQIGAMLADNPGLGARCPVDYYAPAIGLFDLAMRLRA